VLQEIQAPTERQVAWLLLPRWGWDDFYFLFPILGLTPLAIDDHPFGVVGILFTTSSSLHVDICIAPFAYAALQRLV
jgi:hypothetical protein